METTKTLSVKTELIDPQIAATNPENCTISIGFSLQELSFALLQNDTNRFIVLGDYQKASPAISTEALFAFRSQLSENFGATSLAFHTPKFALFPSDLFQAENAEKIAQFQFELSDEEQLVVNEIHTAAITVLFALPKQIATFLMHSFGADAVKHAGYYTISYLLQQYKNKGNTAVHVNFRQSSLEIAVIDKGALQLYNVFDFESAQDVLYFVLNVFEQLALNPQEIPLFVAGELNKSDESWKLLAQYITSVLPESQPDAQYSHTFSNVPKHRYNRIFQAALCE